ncbi:hypothetical protein AKO1_012806 [Acrasis kona]|uniref:B9 domain-containing protein 1 n=1 Tax=Acrasis kona TaxID=1008807 RepID=A0AAW2YWT1_9EUKA
MSGTNCFVLIVNGNLSHAEFPGAKNLACSYQFVYGSDWEVVRVTGEGANMETGLTQLSERGAGTRAIYLWNFPLEITFRSTNPYGWPKLCVNVCEGNAKTTIKGYGWCHVPVNPGRHSNTIRLFKPRNSSIIQGILSSITGKTPEFINPTSICEGEGREVTRVQSEGTVRVVFDVMIKDMTKFGFEPVNTKHHQSILHEDEDVPDEIETSKRLN